MTDDTIAEPGWLAAEPTDRAKLTAIMAAIRRCYAECPADAHPSGPHISTSMAELFIGRMLMEAAAAEREHIRQLAIESDAYYTRRPAHDDGGLEYIQECDVPFADLLAADTTGGTR